MDVTCGANCDQAIAWLAVAWQLVAHCRQAEAQGIETMAAHRRPC
jgi:hypothetical protein